MIFFKFKQEKLINSFFIFLFVVVILTLPNVAHASELIKSTFLTELSSFVEKVLHDSAIKKFVDKIMLAFLFFIVIWEIVIFIKNGLDMERLFETYKNRVCHTELPFIQIKSLHIDQLFKLFIEKRVVDNSHHVGFSTYGLSSSSTIPEF